MVNILIHGCCGHMGRVVANLAAEDENIRVAAGVDVMQPDPAPAFPVFASVKECDADVDVVVDFSTAKAIDALLEGCVEKKLPLILCTTGLSEEQLAKVSEASKMIPILRSANMSVGINLLQKLLAQAAGILYPAGFDIEIVEKHHNQKLDAPSGTALALADSVNGALDNGLSYNLDRSRERKKRDKAEIGIVAVRGGTIVGEHSVIFAGADEVIEFKHQAFSKGVFAKGALEAAKFLAGQEPGMYDMSDVIKM